MTTGRRPVGIPKDYVGGGLMIVLGGLAAGIGSTYSIGSLRQMGAGYFPVAIGVLMLLVGVGMVFSTWLERSPKPSDLISGRAEWRGWSCIVGGLIAFLILGRYGGFVPATAAVVFISALGDRSNSIGRALVLAAGMVVVLVVVFWWALQMTFPLFGWGNT